MYDAAALDTLLNTIDEANKNKDTQDPTKQIVSLNHESSKIDNALSILSELAVTSPEARQTMVEKKGAEIIAAHLAHRPIPAKGADEGERDALSILASLAQDTRSHEAATMEGVLEKAASDIGNLNFEEVISGKGDPTAAEAALKLLQNLVENDQNEKNVPLIKDSKAPEAVSELIGKFKDIPKATLQNNQGSAGLDRAFEVIGEAMRTADKMLPDPLLGRVMAKANGKENIIGALDNLSSATVAPEEVDADKLNELKDIPTSDIPLNKAIGDALSAVGALAGNPRIGKDVDLLDERSPLYEDILNLMSNIPDDPKASYKTLQALKNTLTSMGKESIIENQESLAPIPEVADTLISLYPNVPVIVDAAEEVKSLATTGMSRDGAKTSHDQSSAAGDGSTTKGGSVADQEAPALEEHDEALAAARDDFGALADLLENLAAKHITGQATEADQRRLNDATDILRDNAEAGKDLDKVGQHDLITPLAKLLAEPNVDLPAKQNIVDTFAKISGDEDQASKLAATSDALKGLAGYIKNEGSAILASELTKQSPEVQNVVKASETLEGLIQKSMQDKTLPKGNDLKEIAQDLTEAVKPACNRGDAEEAASLTKALSTLSGLDQGAADAIQAANVGDNLTRMNDKVFDDLTFARAYAAFIANNATTPEKRTHFSEVRALERLNKNTKKFADDLELNTSTVLAHGSMSTSHPENAKRFLASNGIDHLVHIINDYKEEPELMDKVAKLLNILSDTKNECTGQLSDIEAPRAVTDLLMTARDGGREPAVVDCLNACNNMIIPSKDQQKKYLDQNMDKVLLDLIENPPSKSTGQLALVVLKNLLGPAADARRTKHLIEESNAVEAICK